MSARATETDDGDRPRSDEETARRRDEVLRRMLNTPPKPHKAGGTAKEKGDRDEPDRRRGKRSSG